MEKTHMMHVPFVDLAAQHQTLVKEIEQAIARVVQKTDFILGNDVALFEKEFAAFCEVSYAVGVDSGTSALELAIRACGIGPGDEVITTANTFIATALAISHAGATPVLVDVDPQTYTMDIASLEKALTKRTKGIIPVHLYGQPADMDPILEIAQQYELVVIEDACQAHGARYKGKRAGSLGHAAAFSFYPAKNLGACGDGGIVVTNNENIANTIQLLRNYGQREKNRHLLPGYNRRLDTLQAAILRAKLPHLDAWTAARQEHAQQYHERLSSIEGMIIPTIADYAESVWHLYVIQVEGDRNGLQTYLSEHGISTGQHYPTPIHLQPAYQELGYQEGTFPVTEAYTKKIVSLPMYAELTPDMIGYVTDTIKRFMG